MDLSLEEAAWVAGDFREIMNRDPTQDELEFWRAVVDCKRMQEHFESGAA